MADWKPLNEIRGHDDIDSPENIYPSNLQIEIEIIGITTIEIGKIKINKTISNKYLIVLTLNKYYLVKMI